MALTVNQIYQFNVAYQGAVSSINYLIDFGDGTTTGWFSGTLSTTTTVSHIFSKTGQFAISVSARSVVGMTVKIRHISITNRILVPFFF
jgi:PKD repeat protein